MSRLATRVTGLEERLGAKRNGVVLTVDLYEGETHGDAMAAAFPDGPPPHELTVLLHRFKPRSDRSGR